MLLQNNGPAAYYYYIRGRAGRLLIMSSNVPLERVPYSTQPLPNAEPLHVEAKTSAASSSSTPDYWHPPSDLLREVTLTTLPGEFLVVGRSIQSDLAELYKSTNPPPFGVGFGYQWDFHKSNLIVAQRQ